MSNPLGNYSFLPWLRLGLGNKIVPGASDGGRAVIDVTLDIEGAGVAGGTVTDSVPKKVALFGPGDIQGIERRAVVRTEPRDWSTNFEPNYLAAIELYDEDFPWRYTPAQPDAKGRLLPWLALAVLEERETSPEFTDGKDVTGKPLPYIEVDDKSLFPPSAQTWAWAHVHVNRGLADGNEIVSTDMNKVLPRLQGVLNQNADLALSRIVSPRRLEPNKAYHAFLIPAFETGRRAGLGLDPYAGGVQPTACAWESGAKQYPYYYRWYFHTGGKGDFESLVRLLKPRPVDYRVGRRDIDVQHPGMNVEGVQAGRPDLGGILKLGGALQVPDESLDPDQLREKQKYEQWATPYPQPIQRDLATLVNLADDYADMTAEAANRRAKIYDPDATTGQPDRDPVIAPPLYGMWHAMARRVLADRANKPIAPNDNWLHELNLDPRFRVAAGFGTRVVQEQQEKFMDAAWRQIGAVLEGNRRIRLGQAACGTSTAWYDAEVRALMSTDVQKGLQLAGPLNKRTMFRGETVHAQYTGSRIPPAMTCGAMRRVMRPRGRLIRNLPFDDITKPGDVFRWMSSEISPAPPHRPTERPDKPVDLPGLGKDIERQLDPTETIPRRVKGTVRLPRRIEEEIGPRFVEAMVYPEFDTPMYEPLKSLSSELFLPNVELISDNSITLLKSNQKFIEAYMAGLNHEFARELLWREYPTDQRGSYFRQFWDVSATFNAGGVPAGQWKETLRDITPLHRWDPASKLQDHNNRKPGSGGDLVLAIRGELLKRYPTAVVYAHRARWELKGDGTPDLTKPRRFVELDAGEEARPPLSKVLTPMYDAKIDPDIYFFGFDLTVDQARGGTGVPPDTDAGWFFVLKERPGEPRFGLDIDKATDLEVWNDLSWEDMEMPGGACLTIADLRRSLTKPAAVEKQDQYQNDVNVAWSVDMSAADLAYILFQTPVLVGVHASEMLPPKKRP